MQGGHVMEEVEVVMVRYSCEVRAPGALHIVLDSVSAEASYVLENRSGQPLRYRQAHIAGLPFLLLPPFSAAGFAWQVADRSVPREVGVYLCMRLKPFTIVSGLMHVLGMKVMAQ